MRETEDGPCPPSYIVVSCPGAFKQIAAEAKVSVGVADISLIIIELPGKTVGHVRLDRAGITLPEDQVSGPDIDEPVEDSGR